MKTLALSTLLLALAACGADSVDPQAGNPGERAMARIEGNVVYRERIMLRPGSELEVRLEDVSRADAAATIITHVTQPLEGAPPYGFALDYDASQIDKRMRYALRATIRNGGRLLFTNTEYIDPFSGNPVEVLVRSVPRPEPAAGPALELEGVRWVLATLGGAETVTGAGGKSPDIQFSAEEKRAAGFSGCNRFSGSYSREGVAEQGSPLSFGPTAGTMMACPEGMKLERQYLGMLGSVTAFRLRDGVLALLAGDEELATFQSAD